MGSKNGFSFPGLFCSVLFSSFLSKMKESSKINLKILYDHLSFNFWEIVFGFAIELKNRYTKYIKYVGTFGNYALI